MPLFPTELSMPPRRCAAILVVPAALAATGCTGGLNTSNDLDGAPELPALAAPPAQDAAAQRVDPAEGAPSLAASNGLDRRGWPVVVVAVPRGQVEVQPTYVTTLLPDRSLPRDRGEFPRAGQALDETGSPAAELVQGAANAAGSPLFLLSAPVEMVMGRWWWITERDHPLYERVPTPVRPSDPWVWITPPPGPPDSAQPAGPAPAPSPAIGSRE